jgi:hypothetical protein
MRIEASLEFYRSLRFSWSLRQSTGDLRFCIWRRGIDSDPEYLLKHVFELYCKSPRACICQCRLPVMEDKLEFMLVPGDARVASTVASHATVLSPSAHHIFLCGCSMLPVISVQIPAKITGCSTRAPSCHSHCEQLQAATQSSSTLRLQSVTPTRTRICLSRLGIEHNSVGVLFWWISFCVF